MKVLFAVLFMLAAGAAGCGESNDLPPAGTQAWGTDNCLYTSTGASWVKGLWCRKQISGTLTDYYLADKIWRRVDESDAKYYQWYDYGLDLWYAQDRVTNSVYVKTADGRLLTSYAYWLERAQPQQGSTSPGPAPSNTTPTGGTGTVPKTPNTVEYWQVQQQIQEMNDRIVSRILAPDCVGSYNGCR